VLMQREVMQTCASLKGINMSSPTCNVGWVRVRAVFMPRGCLAISSRLPDTLGGAGLWLESVGLACGLRLRLLLSFPFRESNTNRRIEQSPRLEKTRVAVKALTRPLELNAPWRTPYLMNQYRRAAQEPITTRPLAHP